RQGQHAGDLIGATVHFKGAAAKRGAASETLPQGASDDDLRGAFALIAGLGKVVAEGEAAAECREEILRDFKNIADLAAERGLHGGGPTAVASDGLES